MDTHIKLHLDTLYIHNTFSKTLTAHFTHCILYNGDWTLHVTCYLCYTIHHTLHTTYHQIHTAHLTVHIHISHCTTHTACHIYCILYSTHYSPPGHCMNHVLDRTHCIPHSLHTAQHTLWPLTWYYIQCTLDSTHTTHYKPHRSHCTLHNTHGTPRNRYDFMELIFTYRSFSYKIINIVFLLEF